jgi:hypothetical protein
MGGDMNSQTFETYRRSKLYSGKSTGSTMATIIPFHWIAAIILIAIVILFPERPAWGDYFEGRINYCGIQANASRVELGGFLEVFSD